MRNHARLFLISLLLVGLSTNVLAQTTKTTVAAGAWGTASNWSPSGAPTGDNIIIINHAMTNNGALNLTAWSAGRGITINSGGSLALNGSLTLEGSGMSLNVNGGSLSVTGTLTTQNGGGVFNINSGNVSVGTLQVNYGSTFNVNANGVLNATNLNTGNNSTANFYNYGNTTVTGNSIFDGRIHNYGNLTLNNVTGTSSGNSRFYTYGGSTTRVTGDFTVVAANSVFIGEGDPVVDYADMIIEGNLFLSGGDGDLIVENNGRMAVFGNLTSLGGGGSRSLVIEDGGQTFVAGDITINGGGDAIDNNNTDASYIGLYVGDTSSVTFNSGNGFLGLPSSEWHGGQNGSSSGYAFFSEMEADNNAFFLWLLGLNANPLPIQLMSFNVKVAENIVNIVWVTGSEKDNDYFTIEKSIDGKNFEPLAIVAGAGNSNSPITYNYQDDAPQPGLNFYRLRQTDFDGKFEIFDTKVINFSASKPFSLTVYPNPTSDVLYLGYKGYIDQMEVIDMSGRVVRSAMGSANQQVDVYSLPVGTYVLRAVIANEVFTARFIKN